MNRRPIPLALAVGAGLALVGCGNSSSSVGLGDSLARSSTDTFQSKLVTGSVSGTMALLDFGANTTRFVPIRVAQSADFQTITAIIDGTTYTLPASPGGSGSASGGTYSDGSVTVTFTILNSATFREEVGFSDPGSLLIGDSIAGAVTPADALPSTSVSYEGEWEIRALGSTGFATVNSGGARFDVDFAAASDQVSAEFREGSLAGPSVGDPLDMSITDSGFSGTMAYDDGTYTGDLNLDGTFYGPSAEQVGGALHGELDPVAPGDTANVFGSFYGD